ncbi:ABC transporter permease [Halorientalis halophila]|uniref:ABC transporter permease n=1 Tax=Halorientalis halophila TaxID=3108499 RepID=UPI003009003F
MTIPSLLRKEVLWSRHRLATLCFLLLLLPAFFAITTLAFGTVVPEDTPIGIVAEDDTVTDEELRAVQGGLALYSEPRLYEDRAGARRALERETVYAVLEVPPGLLDESTTNATLTLVVDGSVVPFEEPSKVIQSVASAYLNANLDGDVTVEREVVGEPHTLSEYLMPTFLLGVVVLFAFAYLPYNLARERAVLDRLLVESSLDALVAAKIGYFAALMLVPTAAFAAVAVALGYSVTLLSSGAVAVLLLTFVSLAAISTSIMLLTDFGTLGRFSNVAVMLGAFSFSSLVYPVGFFSPIRREIARAIPLHYSMIVTRSLTLKETSLALYGDYVLGLVGFALLTVLALKLSIERYERTL